MVQSPPDSVIKIVGTAKSLSVKNNICKDFSFALNASGSELVFNLNSSSVTLPEQSELKDISLKLNTQPDTLAFTVNWDNKDKNFNKGTIVARGKVEKDVPGSKYALLKIYIDSTDIYSHNNLWRINNSSVLIDSSSIKINKLSISDKDRYYLVDGTISENKK